jgi:transcriptional regulator with XRE-family HTH domain
MATRQTLSPARKLALYRESRGWSKAELARRLRCDKSFIGHIETGRRTNPGLEVAARFEILSAKTKYATRAVEWLAWFAPNPSDFPEAIAS